MVKRHQNVNAGACGQMKKLRPGEENREGFWGGRYADMSQTHQVIEKRTDKRGTSLESSD